MTSIPPEIPTPHFPSHPHPRVWLLTSAACPFAIELALHLLAHGDYVVAGVKPSDISGDDSERGDEFRAFWEEVIREGWRERCKTVGLDERVMGQCQVVVAEALEAFGRVDILFCCTSEAIVGAVEELASSPRCLTLVRDQFETNYFGPVNIIKAVLPSMRRKSSGHIIVLTGITGHLGTPGLGMYCASGWALEGFCDSLAYEIAPFNIKMTIVQSNLEINILTNKITYAPPLPQYSAPENPAPLFRTILTNLLSHLPPSPPPTSTPPPEPPLPPTAATTPTTPEKIKTHHPPLPPHLKTLLIAETTHALLAIGGHENPPARHIVGYDAVASVKEKLKTVSEELEDFVEVSCAVDIAGGEGDVAEGDGGAAAGERDDGELFA